MPRGSRGGERGGGTTRARGTATGRGRGRGRGRGASQSTSAAIEVPSEGSTPQPDTSVANSVEISQPEVKNAEIASSIPNTTTLDTFIAQPTPSSSRTSQTPAASTSRGASRFKPKNVRRDETERKKLEEARNRELATKIKAEERELRQEERRARRGRGRGALPQGGLIRRTVTAQGPFSALAPENVRSGSAPGSWASGGFGGATPKAESNGGYNRYHPRREHEQRVNIDLLNGLTDGHAEDGTPLYQPDRYGQKSTGNLPVGMLRTRHEEPEVKVKTQAELEAEDRQDDDNDLFVESTPLGNRDITVDSDNEIWNTLPDDEVKVKKEPGTAEDDEDVEMADIPETAGAPPSPELRKKPVIGEDGVAIDEATERKKRKEKKKAEDPEFMNTAMDIEALLRSLQFSTPAEGQEGQEKDDQLFIFQLPPILPPLAKLSTDGAIDLTLAEPSSAGVKTEGDAELPRQKYTGLPPDGGFIGRLNVRKSGKVELDWGGTTLDLGMETQTDFLTSAMIIEQKEHVESAEESAGVAYGMGQVFGRFVLAPPCEAEDEWDPDLTSILDGIGEGAIP
ncbi:hypothetical protein F5Y16DRAFT_47061 [Xylariaceae sp. FL0255]|nr:hypothetical protein F5Y16DRAFT_47061 [Xylariaceae sp. FL0255]